jgi:hypothetical protein
VFIEFLIRNGSIRICTFILSSEYSSILHLFYLVKTPVSSLPGHITFVWDAFIFIFVCTSVCCHYVLYTGPFLSFVIFVGGNVGITVFFALGCGCLLCPCLCLQCFGELCEILI